MTETREGQPLIIEISVAAVSLAVIVLIVVMIRTLIAVSKAAATLDRTMQEIKGKAEAALEESVRTLRETRHLVEDLQQKSRQADQIFRSVDEVGRSLREVSHGIVRTAEVHRKRLGNVLAVIGAGVELVNRWRKGKDL
jgi:uncharacterized protein YoxC